MMLPRAPLLRMAGCGIVIALAAASVCGQGPRAPARQPSGPRLFLVIAPARFHAALAEYVEYKKSVRPTQLVSLEQIVGTTQGADDPERLKRYLYEAWRGRRLGYVLLVGDVDVMPVRYMVLDRKTPAAFDYAFYPSDLYYADLARHDGSFDDWNAMKKGFHAHYFGEVRGEKNKHDPINYDRIAYHPQIAFGRWPVSTEEEVRAVAEKTVAYEKSIRDGTHPGLRRVDFFNTAGFRDLRDQMVHWGRNLPAGWSAGDFFYTDDKKPYHTPPPDDVHVTSAMNQGAALIAHVGHGYPNGWFKSFSTKCLSKLQDADRLPVVISVGCNTANFAPLPPYEAYVDVEGREHAGTNHKEVFTAPPPPPSPYQKGKFNTSGLGEKFLKRRSTGGVVYIGCNTGAQPCAITLLEGFLVALKRSEAPLVGDCWASAVRYYYDKEHLATLKPNNDWYPPSIFFQGMKFMFFGDPTLPFARPAKMPPPPPAG